VSTWPSRGRAGLESGDNAGVIRKGGGMNEKRVIEKNADAGVQRAQARQPDGMGEAGPAQVLKVRRARTRKPDSPDEAARNNLEAGVALRDAENAP